MNLGIMQPYFFPYLGYFSLIAATDHWIVFDTPQYIRKGWVNRNRILKKGGDWKYFNIRIEKCPRDTPISDVVIDKSYDVRSEVFRSLDFYYEVKAPFYNDVVSWLDKVLDSDFLKLSELLVHLLEKTCEYIDLDFSYQVFSKMDLSIDEVGHPGEWALRISQALQAKSYINPPGGREIFVPKEFSEAGIELRFLQHNFKSYGQRSNDKEFISGLSILDAMMFCEPSTVKAMVFDYDVIN